MPTFIINIVDDDTFAVLEPVAVFRKIYKDIHLLDSGIKARADFKFRELYVLLIFNFHNTNRIDLFSI